MKDFSFQGKIWLGERLSNGKPGALRWVDDAGTLQIKLTSDKSERTESWSGNRLTSATLNKANKAEFSLSLNAFSADNLVLGTFGTKAVIAGGSASAEALPTGLAVGDVVALDHRNISALVLTDSGGTPATLTAGTDYDIESASGGLVVIKSLGGTPYTQPFKAAYTYGDGVNVTMFSQGAPERYLMLDGINTVSNERVVVRLYRAKFDPVSQLDLISDDFGKLDLAGGVLFDSTNAADAALGGFGRIELPGED